MSERGEVFRTSACTGKHPFTTRSLAEQVAKRMSRRGQRAGAYRCVVCGVFHVGHQRRTVDAKRSRPLLKH